MSQLRIYSVVGGIFLGDLHCDRRERGSEGGLGHHLFSHPINIDSSQYWGFISKQSRHGLAVKVLPSRE